MNSQFNMGYFLIIAGLILAGIGLVLVLLPSIPWLGRLPGDVRIEGANYRIYFPIVTCLILSIVLSLLLWLVRILRS